MYPSHQIEDVTFNTFLSSTPAVLFLASLRILIALSLYRTLVIEQAVIGAGLEVLLWLENNRDSIVLPPHVDTGHHKLLYIGDCIMFATEI